LEFRMFHNSHETELSEVNAKKPDGTNGFPIQEIAI
jgi:hypothetical protein